MPRFALAVVLCLLPLAACGGEERSGRTVTTPANSTVTVTGAEYSFDPSAVVVRGAGTLTIRLRNDGSLAHNIKVRRDGEQVGGTPSIPAGESVSVRLNLEHGTYELICTVGDHAELGMTGTLRVN